MNHSAPIATRAHNRQPGLVLHPTAEAPAITLTQREKEVLWYGVPGASRPGKWPGVNCSESGVNYHFCNIRRKFGVSSRWTAVFRPWSKD